VRVALDGQPLFTPLAGVGHYTRELTLALAHAERANRYYVVAPRPIRRLGRRCVIPHFAEPNVEVVVPGWWTTVRAAVQRRLGHDPELGMGRVQPCDVYHATNNIFPYRIAASRHVLTIQDLTLLLFPEWHPADRLAAMVPALEPAVRAADHIITPSRATRNDLLKLLPADPARVSVVPDGVSPLFVPVAGAEVAAQLAPLGLRPDTYLLFMGTIEPRKNLLRLLEAMELAAPEIGPLVLAGGRGWNDAGILSALERLEAAGRARSLGYVPDRLRPALLTGARAFVYPSLYEGFGLPPLEAMACGAPIVASHVSSLPEVVGDAALLVDPEDVQALAGAIERIWRDHALRADLRARGLARAREFSWHRTARLTLDVYRDVLETAPRAPRP
jgi:alpha-1,3-rhamnosyl/mannosyltransferase